MSMPRQSQRARRASIRRRAEEQQAARRAARLGEVARRAASVAALANAIVVRRPARLDATMPSVRNLLGLAKVDRSTCERVGALFAALGDEVPERCTVMELPWVLLLAGVPWHRAPRSFRGEGAPEERRAAFLRHVLGPFPVPAFLAGALDRVERVAIARVPVEDQWVAQLCAAVASGRSARTLGGRLLPTGFTRAMAHTFFASAAALRPAAALRRAQIQHLGGPEAFGRALGGTTLSAWLGPGREAPWHRALTQVCARPWLTSLRGQDLADAVAWIDGRLRADTSFTLAGRTERSVLDAVDRDRAVAALDPVPLGRSGLRGLHAGDAVIRELRSATELAAEGARMRHCVGMYQNLVASGKVAIFALTGSESATIEVVPGLLRVVQVKGKANAAPTQGATALVARWAAANGLR